MLGFGLLEVVYGFEVIALVVALDGSFDVRDYLYIDLSWI